MEIQGQAMVRILDFVPIFLARGAGARHHVSAPSLEPGAGPGVPPAPAKQHVLRPDVGTAQLPRKGRAMPTNHFRTTNGQTPSTGWVSRVCSSWEVQGHLGLPVQPAEGKSDLPRGP